MSDFVLSDLPVAASYSGGTSSEWLIEATRQGVIPRPRVLIVVSADTGEEHSWTYVAMAEVEERCKQSGIPYLRCANATRLGDDLISIRSRGRTRVDQPPVYIAKDGGGRGQSEHRCTRHYKLAPMRRTVARWLKSKGLKKRVEKWIGFAADEAGRAIKSMGKHDLQWEVLRFPAIELGVTRAQQRADLVRWTGRAPKFSMCVCCPKKTPGRWLQTEGADLERAVQIDEAVRDSMYNVGLTDGDAYLCDRLIPVRELIERGDPQPNLPGLESYCDGGACFL